MEIFHSTNGAPIACWQSGQGTPLLLIHGTSGDRLTWTPVLTKLERHFTVWTLDRRGRGHSGDDDAYSLMAECEDIATVVDAIGERVHVFAHSFGGLCALEAARLTENIDKLMIYEPPLSLTGSGWTQTMNQTMQSLLAEDGHEDVLLLFLREIVKCSEREITLIQAAETWPERIAAAHTIHRELVAIDNYRFEAHKFRTMQTPTQLFLGGDSPTRRRDIALTLKASLPNSRIVELEGQQHGAVRTAPDLLVDEIVRFCYG